MGSNCKGSSEDLQDFLNDQDVAETYTIFSLVLLTAVIVVSFSAFIFCKRNSEQRPLFVIL